MTNPRAVAVPDPVPTPAHQGREERPWSRSRRDEELKAIALQQYASAGFAGTSLQNIADIAGYSKSSVLYHFASKEALLDAAISPAIDKLAVILGGLANHGSGYSGALSVEDFIDFLLERRLEVRTFINQGQSLRGIPVTDPANALFVNLLSDGTATYTSAVGKSAKGFAALKAGLLQNPENESYRAALEQLGEGLDQLFAQGRN